MEPHAQEAVTEKVKGNERTVGWKDRKCLGDECPDTLAEKALRHRRMTERAWEIAENHLPLWEQKESVQLRADHEIEPAERNKQE